MTRSSTPLFVRYMALPMLLLLTVSTHAYILSAAFLPTLSSTALRELLAYGMSGLVLGVFLLMAETLYPLEQYLITYQQRHTDIIYNVVMGFVFGVGHLLVSRVPTLQNMTGIGFNLSKFPFYIQFILGVSGHDLLLYAWHRTLHESGYDFLWRLHEAHHAPRRFSFLSGARGHILDLSFLLIALAMTYMLLGLSHVVRPWIFLYPVMAGAVHHTNVDFRLGFFNWFFLGPELHRAHHDSNLKDGLSSYASCFPLWDVIFGTSRPRRSGGETIYGLAYDYDDRASFIEAFVRPFQHKESLQK